MKVLMTGIRFPPAPGGAETHMLEISRRLARWHDIQVFTSDLYREIPFRRMSPSDPGFSSYKGIPVRRFRGYTMGGDAHYVFMPGMVLPMLKYRADIVHTHSYGYFQVNLAAFKRALQDTAFIITPHYHPEWSMAGGDRRKRLRSLYDGLIARWVLDRADAIIGVSRHEMELMARLGFDTSKVHLIPNGIDFSLYERIPDPEPFLRRYGLLEKKRDGWNIVMYAGRLAPNKGLIQLVNAAAQVIKGHPKTIFVLVGDDAGMRAKIEREVERLGLSSKFVMTGHIEEDEVYRSAISSCDVFVLPSEYEAFGIVLAEAMACEKPCVGTRVGGVPEVIDDGRTGFIVEYDDVDALATRISEILSMPDKGHSMGVLGREKVRKNFTWDSVAEQIDALYRRVAGEGNGKP